MTHRYARLFAWLCFLILAGASLPSWPAANPVTIGVLAFRPKPETLARWQPTADYLAGRTGRPFHVEALTYPELEAAIAQRRVDFVLTNPSHYVQMTKRNGMSSPLATLIERANGLPMTQFGGVIITRAGRTDIATLADLRGKTVAAPDYGSLGGYQVQALELVRAGLTPSRDIHLLVTGMPHDRVVEAVLDGRADVGFARTGLIEAMLQAGSLAPGRIDVLNRRQVPGFPFLLSTQLFPEWPFAAMPGTDAHLAQEVAKALFSLRPDAPAARAGAYHGWAIPTDYEPVRAMLQELRLPPYDQVPAFTWRDILVTHGLAIAVAGTSVVIIVALSFLLAARQRQLRAHEQHLAEERKQLLAALGEGVYGVDPAGLCMFVNPAALDMLGYRSEELLGQDQHLLIHHHRASGEPYPHAQCPIYQTLADGETRSLEEWFFRKDGTAFPVEMTATPIEHDGVRAGAVVVFRDIRARKRLEAELQALASTDTLTGLPNRRQFLAALNQEIARSQRAATPPSALLMLDLDHFKRVNDRYGHAGGDQVLRRFAELVRASLRRTDLAGRLGGEEFAILLFGCEHAGALEFAQRLRQRVEAEAIALGDKVAHITVSIGVALLAKTDASADATLARADAALYQAKAKGRNRVEADARLGPVDVALQPELKQGQVP